jgi:hypothetical protein
METHYAHGNSIPEDSKHDPASGLVRQRQQVENENDVP